MPKYFCIIFLISNFSFSQSTVGEAVYGIKQTTSFFDEQTKKDKADIAGYLDMIDESIQTNFPKFSFVLKFNESEAFFEMRRGIVNSEDLKVKMAYILAQGDDKFYYNKTSDSVVMQTEVYGAKFRVLTKISDIEWKISNERKQIDEFLCYKATASFVTVNDAGTFNKNVVAWFAPGLPISFGPKGYSGLPGLILELQDDKTIYFLTHLNISKSTEKSTIEKLPKGKIVTKEQLDNLAFENANFRN